MSMFEVNVTLTNRDTGETVDDVMLVERDTAAEAERAALDAFGSTAKLRSKVVEVPVVTAPGFDGDVA